MGRISGDQLLQLPGCKQVEGIPHFADEATETQRITCPKYIASESETDLEFLPHGAAYIPLPCYTASLSS